jgi:hypothetical protein
MTAGHPANVAFARKWREERGLSQHDAEWYDDDKEEESHSFDGELSIWHERYREDELLSFERAEYAAIFPQNAAPRDDRELSPIDDIARRSWPLTEDTDFRVADRLLKERAPMQTACDKCGQIHEGSAAEGRAWFKAHSCASVIAA